MDVEKLKQILGLKPLPQEGGFYVESYRSGEKLAAALLPSRYSGDRCLGTAIYFLLTPGTFSALHKLASDEIYHFYLGDPVELLLLRKHDTSEVVNLGTDLANGMRPQIVVPRETWQGSRLVPGGSFALLGTTMAPGFEFADFELAKRDVLVARYPAFSELIQKLTR